MEQAVAAGTDAEAVVLLFLIILIVLMCVIRRHHLQAFLSEQRVCPQRGQPAVDIARVGNHVAESHGHAHVDRLRRHRRLREVRLAEQLHIVDEGGMRHAERPEDPLAQEVVIALPRDDLHNPRQQKIVGVGILKRRIRLKLQRLTQQPVLQRPTVLLNRVVVGDNAAQFTRRKLR